MTVAEILLKAADLIEPPEKWTTGVLARDAFGNAVDSDDPSACSWCAVGAIYAVSPDLRVARSARNRLGAITRAQRPDTWIGDWNDENTQAEVVAAPRAAAKSVGAES